MSRPGPDRGVRRQHRGRLRAPSPDRDRGAATVFLLAAGGLVILFGAALAGVGAAVIARHQAQSAADLGALAGAPYVVAGRTVACQEVGEIVAANGGHLVGCRVDGWDILVTVEVLPSGYPAAAGPARARARAGPALSPWGGGPPHDSSGSGSRGSVSVNRAGR